MIASIRIISFVFFLRFCYKKWVGTSASDICKMSDQYGIELKHGMRTIGQTEIHDITWSFPDFIKILENKKTREFRTHRDADVDAPGSKIQLKMLFLGRNNDLIEFYYLSPTSVFIFKSELDFHCQNVRNLSMEYQTIHANKWQYLGTIHNLDGFNYGIKYVTGSTLRLYFQFIVFNDVRLDRHNIPVPQLGDDFENLLNDGSYSDVTMKSVEGEEFRVHKNVLAIRSEVLKAHFEHNTTESITNVIVTPLESEVLREVLNFVYTDKAPRIDEIPERLLSAANYYQLSRLKSLCEIALHKRLTVENAVDTLQLAELHSADSLKQSTLEFIKDGQAHLVIQTQGWVELKSVELIKWISEFIMADVNAE